MERVTGIGGVLLHADDPDLLARWYGERLGVEALPEYPGGYPAAPRDGQAVFAPPGTQPWSLTFQVRDLDALVAELRAAGVEVDTSIEDAPEGRVATLRDPEGNPVRLWQPSATVPAAWSSAPDAIHTVADEPDGRVAPSGAKRRWLPLLPIAFAAAVALVFGLTTDSGEAPQADDTTPTSRFVVPADGGLWVIDVDTMKARRLELGLDELEQVVVRTAG